MRASILAFIPACIPPQWAGSHDVEMHHIYSGSWSLMWPAPPPHSSLVEPWSALHAPSMTDLNKQISDITVVNSRKNCAKICRFSTVRWYQWNNILLCIHISRLIIAWTQSGSLLRAGRIFSVVGCAVLCCLLVFFRFFVIEMKHPAHIPQALNFKLGKIIQVWGEI